MSDDALLEHALNNVPQEYNIEISLLEKRLGDSNDPLTIEELRDALNLKFERLQGNKGKHYRSGDEETALFAGGFKGRCNNCGKHGQKARDCRTDKKNNKNDK